MFGRATITLGIGPHSSFCILCVFLYILAILDSFRHSFFDNVPCRLCILFFFLRDYITLVLFALLAF